MPGTISVVTTFNAAGYQQYGSRMIDSFLAHWPIDIDLHVYAESVTVTQNDRRLRVYDFVQSVPDLTRFKQRWQNDARATGRLPLGSVQANGKQPGIGFKWDAVRFGHKVYAVCDLASRHTGTVIWMDADTVCHGTVSLQFVQQQVPDTVGIAYLGRQNKYSECGLYALNMQHVATREFVQAFKAAYDHAESGIFTMAEWHDSFVFDVIRSRTAQKHPEWLQLDWSQGLIKGEGHPLINSAWGAYLDHLKGNRKQQGRSHQNDLRISRTESYWKQHA